jgi:hypothetical protein
VGAEISGHRSKKTPWDTLVGATFGHISGRHILVGAKLVGATYSWAQGPIDWQEYLGKGHCTGVVWLTC